MNAEKFSIYILSGLLLLLIFDMLTKVAQISLFVPLGFALFIVSLLASVENSSSGHS